MNRFHAFICLSVGFAAGLVIGNAYSKKKYMKKADEEIESVKKLYESKYKPSEGSQQRPEEIKPDENPTEPTNPSEGLQYYTNLYSTNAEREEVPSLPDRFVVISPQDFNESICEANTLFYFADNILTDDDYNPIYNVKDVIGKDCLTTFGRYEDDAVYVHDEKLDIDYEILRDLRTYESIRKKYSVPSEDDDDDDDGN